MRYQDGFKKSIVRRLLVPGAPSVYAISKETGISTQTIYKWLRILKDSVHMTDQQRTPDDWTLPEKNEALLEAASLSPEEEGEWLRNKGLHSGHLSLWKKEIQEALTGIVKGTSVKEKQEFRKQINNLEKEIRRKDKALAEMSALIVLKKKLETLLSDEDV